jgi:hypothetical protein
MKTYMTKYEIKYWTEHNDEPTDWYEVIYALNEIDAMKKFLDMNIRYRKIEYIKEMV